MRGPHNIWRLIRTGATFERTGAMSEALAAFDAPPALRVAARVLGWPFQWLGLEGDPSQPPLVRALTALGPAYIKFGQLLSTRPDVVGPELAEQLKVLQDKLPPSRSPRPARRSRPSSAARSTVSFRSSTRRSPRLHWRRSIGRALSTVDRSSPSRSCARGSSEPFCAMWMPFISRRR